MMLILGLASTGYSHQKLHKGAVVSQDGIFFSVPEAAAVLKKLDQLDITVKKLAVLEKIQVLDDKELNLLKREVELEKREAGIYQKETAEYKELNKVTKDTLNSERRARKGDKFKNLIINGILLKVIFGGLF